VLYPSTFLNYNPSENNSFNLKFFGKSWPTGIDQSPIREWSTTIDSEGSPSLIYNLQFTKLHQKN
jgi:hypothetical protein